MVRSNLDDATLEERERQLEAGRKRGRRWARGKSDRQGEALPRLRHLRHFHPSTERLVRELTAWGEGLPVTLYMVLYGRYLPTRNARLFLEDIRGVGATRLRDVLFMAGFIEGATDEAAERAAGQPSGSDLMATEVD